jgi:hypothetical protein
MDDKTRASLRQIIDYLYADEERHWMEAEEPESGHIFHDITRVTEWLKLGAQKAVMH